MRRALDAYYTPRSAVNSLRSYFPIKGVIFECCAGDGAIVNPFVEDGLVVVTNDIDPKLHCNFQRDAKEASLFSEVNADWVVSNPPFSEAFPIVKNAVESAKIGVAMLLRLSFLEPTYERGEWLQANPPQALIVLPRISFTGDGKTDSVTTAWFIWYEETRRFLRGMLIEAKKPKIKKLV